MSDSNISQDELKFTSGISYSYKLNIPSQSKGPRKCLLKRSVIYKYESMDIMVSDQSPSSENDEVEISVNNQRSLPREWAQSKNRSKSEPENSDDLMSGEDYVLIPNLEDS